MEKKFICLFVLAVGLLGLGVFPTHVEALTVSPPLIEEVIERDASTSRNIRLYNETNESLQIRAEVKGVGFDDITRTPIFQDQTNDPLAAPYWIEAVPAPFIFAPGTAVDVPVNIQVPADANPGTSGAAMLFTATPVSDANNGIGIIGKTGVVILVTVPGAVRETGALLRFSLLGDNQKLLTQAPHGFAAQVKNTGTVLLQPVGDVVVRNLFGREVARFTINSEERRVLPGWVRTLTVENSGYASGVRGEWQPFAFGRYTATLDLPLGDEVIRTKIHYWVFPWRTLGLAALILVVLGVLTRARRRIERQL
jgi:hypothetical protein